MSTFIVFKYTILIRKIHKVTSFKIFKQKWQLEELRSTAENLLKQGAKALQALFQIKNIRVIKSMNNPLNSEHLGADGSREQSESVQHLPGGRPTEVRCWVCIWKRR